jgi:phenylacetate-CoA ligase
MDIYGRVLSGALFPAWESLRGRPTRHLLGYLEHTQWAGRDELHTLQSGLLRRLVRHAYRHTAFYRDWFDAAGVSPEDIRGPGDLARLPLLERGQARTSAAARETTAPPHIAVRKATSGTTGEPMLIAYNADSRHWRDAIRWRGYGWGGYRVGMRAFHFWGFGAEPPRSRFARAKIALDHHLRRDHYVDCTPRGDDYLAGVVAQLRAFRPDVIVTYSRAGAALADHVVRHGSRDWGTIPVLCGAERLWPHDRAILEQAFGPAVFETYGSREFMLIGSECDHHQGLHTSMENLIVEVIVRQPDGTIRSARAGEVGEVVVTDLHNLASPFLRYVIGDLATACEPGPCACGRGLSRIGPIQGRLTETLRDASGAPVSGLVFNILFVSLAEHARQFQAVQHPDGTITLKIVPSHRGAALPRIVHDLTRSFAGKYVPGIAVTIQAVDDIAPTASGKRQVVIVEGREPPTSVPAAASTARPALPRS